MKCMPTTRSGRDVTAASLVIGIELVLEARIAPSVAASSSCLKIFSLRSTFSVAASISRSASTGSAAVRIRPTAASASDCSTLPFSTSFDSEPWIAFSARSSWPGATSTNVIS